MFSPQLSGVWLEFITATTCSWGWCASWLARLICSWIILRESSSGSLLICCPLAIRSTRLSSFAFRSSKVRHLLLDLDRYWCSDPLGMFTLLLKRTTEVLAPRLSVVFRRLVRLGSFPACWSQANITPIPNGTLYSSVANYRPISITSLLSKVFERLISVHLGRFMQLSGVLPSTQFAYRKGLGTCDALLCVTHTLQTALESGQEARVVQIDFSAAFDRINHQGIQ